MHKILVINNDLDTMSLLKSWFEKRRYVVEYTGNGEEVPQLMNEFQPDVVIVDVLQNKVAEQLKANNETAKVPILLMTGYANARDYPADNSDDVIVKPFNLGLLEEKIERLIV